MRFDFPPAGADAPAGPAAVEWPLSAFGATGNGYTDDLPAIQDAIDSGEILLVEPGTYLVDGLITLRSDLVLVGTDQYQSIFKLADAANTHVMRGDDCSRMYLAGFTLDGNKANQTAGSAANIRGLYLLDASTNNAIERLHVKDVQDHGIFFSGVDSGKDTVLRFCTAADVGRAEHLAAGGAGGTAFVGGQNSTLWFGCISRRAYLNGFKNSRGTWIGCQGWDSVGGGGLELGFTESNTDARILGCRFENNYGHGIHNIGAGDRMVIADCICKNNGSAGINLGNGVIDCQVVNNQCTDNGYIYKPAFVRGSASGIDNISIVSSGLTGPNSVILSGNVCSYTEELPEQLNVRYNLYVDDNQQGLHILENNDFSQIVTGTEVFRLLESDSSTRIKGFNGHSANQRDISTTTAPADTATNDLKTFTIIARHVQIGSSILIQASGLLSGTAGTKVVRFYVGSENAIIINAAAGVTGRWFFNGRVDLVASATWMATGHYGVDTQTPNLLTPFAVPGSLDDDMIIKFSATKGAGADGVTQEFLKASLDG